MTLGLIVYLFIISLILLFAVVSNFLVIGIVAYYRKLRTVTHVLICNVALSDILLAVVYMPQKLHDMTHADFYHEGIVLCKFINSFPIFVITISCYTLVFISFERRRAIIESNKVQMTLRHTLNLLPIIWIGSFIVAIPTVLEYTVYNINTTSYNVTTVCGHSFVEPIVTKVNCLFVTTVSFVIPLILMFNNYTRIIVFINKRCSRITAQAGNGLTVNKQLTVGISSNNLTVQSFHLNKNRIKVVKMLVLMAVAFVVCWLPFGCLYVYTKLAGEDASLYSDGTTTIILNVLVALSTAYNVILYIIFNTTFRQAVKTTIVCYCNQIIDGSQITAVSATVRRQEGRARITEVD